jgi:2-phosphosulfolactate phosphatase
MGSTIEVLFSPAEYAARRDRGFANTTCVVFDVLRATSVMVTGLAHGAAGFIPVAEISEALALQAQRPDALLAGEREGLRIGASLTGGVEFALGNSPREYTPARVAGKTIITTTTNGTRALRACAAADNALVASFLNLQATADWITRQPPEHLLLLAAGTGKETALEDVLAAGALCDALMLTLPGFAWLDSAEIARRTFREAAGDLPGALGCAINARRLRANPALSADVDDCLRRDVHPLVARLERDGVVRKVD